MNKQINIKDALEAVEADVNAACNVIRQLEDNNCYVSYAYPNEYMASRTEKAFTTLLLLAEALGLEEFRRLITKDLETARNRKDGLAAVEFLSEIGESELLASNDLFKTIHAFKSLYGLDKNDYSVVSLIDVLRNCEYSLTLGKGMDVPSDEHELHERIETILRCVYPDLKHKPEITKPIKNFEPDTGIPSARTLIEYKYVDSLETLKRVSDEILADTQGYKSKNWGNFIYLIYETKRFQSEKKWRLHLEECGNPENTDVIVIRGEQPKKKAKAKNKTARKTSKVIKKSNATDKTQ